MPPLPVRYSAFLWFRPSCSVTESILLASNSFSLLPLLPSSNLKSTRLITLLPWLRPVTPCQLLPLYHICSWTWLSGPWCSPLLNAFSATVTHFSPSILLATQSYCCFSDGWWSLCGILIHHPGFCLPCFLLCLNSRMSLFSIDNMKFENFLVLLVYVKFPFYHSFFF